MEGRRAVAGGRIERGGTLARRRRDARRSTTAIDARWRCGRSERRKKRRTRPRRAHLSKKLAAKSLMSSADSNISSTPSSPSSRVRHSYALTTSLNFFSDSASPGFLSGWCFSASFLRWIRVGRRRAGEGVRFEAAGAVVVVVGVKPKNGARLARRRTTPAADATRTCTPAARRSSLSHRLRLEREAPPRASWSQRAPRLLSARASQCRARRFTWFARIWRDFWFSCRPAVGARAGIFLIS